MSRRATSAADAVLAKIDGARDEMLGFLADLVRIPTVNPPGERYPEAARAIGATLERFGYEVEYVVPRGEALAYPRLNVVGRLAGARDRPVLHFNGHFDVVPAGEGWQHAPFGAEARDGVMWGRGTADQKAGIAASIFAVEAIRRAGVTLGGTVEQSGTVDEESGGFAGVADLCDRGYISADRTDWVVITEPLDPERVCLGHRGVYWFEVTAHGATAHGSMPTLGRNAADAMARFITQVNAELKPRLAMRGTAMPVEPPAARVPSINLNALHAGQPADVEQTACVPDTCVAIFDRRFIIEESSTDVRAEIAALVEAARAADPGIRWTTRDLMLVEPVLTPADARVARAFADCVAEVLGRGAAFIASPGTYDQKHVVRRGGVRECIAYGPGRLETTHRPDEHVAVADLVAATKVMALATLRLLGER